ncbi:zinc finger BED domain-containing protein RICESLEEPER 1-like [Pistacia vera]|uniref:zinc finger BED domain-containing protein RICESLEEPER 1-like n=1 Tax=Pistacia vera TaxID=55513 RepID=UPI001263C804|nr:zinc finger BED domain-containing protein RICESLEEPER 1-like [Pistacia vera]
MESKVANFLENDNNNGSVQPRNIDLKGLEAIEISPTIEGEGLILLLVACGKQIHDIVPHQEQVVVEPIVQIQENENLEQVIANYDLELHQLDIKAAFLNCDLEDEEAAVKISSRTPFEKGWSRTQDSSEAQAQPRGIYSNSPNLEDWDKVEKVCQILKVFSDATNINSGSDYPTSNKFLAEVCRVKILLDRHANDKDDFVRSMVRLMKANFDKYWGECNLLMAITAVLDTRCKMRVIEGAFPKIFGPQESRTHVVRVQEALYELYGECVADMQSSIAQRSADVEVSGGPSSSGVFTGDDSSGWSVLLSLVETTDTVASEKSDLDCYLDEGSYKCQEAHDAFDALAWWKWNNSKYPVLSKMAQDVLAIPITSVASEDSFSAGSRVIDTYRASLFPETIQVLLCVGDWCCNLNGLKKESKRDVQPMEITLPIPSAEVIQ